MRERIREIIIQTCEELGVHIVKGVLARDHVHMFLSIPPKLSLSDVMQRIKGRSSRRIQMEFPDLRKRYWPRLMTFADMAVELSAALGRDVQYIPITFEDFHASVAQAGGDFVADVFTAIARETLDGRNEHLADGVQRALGRQPRDFAEFAQTAARSGAWTKAA